MLLSTLLLTAALAPQGPTGISAALVINEFSYDDSSTDTLEFVEIYNAGTAAVDLTGWSLAAQDPSGPNPGYTLNPVILEAGGFYVIGNAAVPNVDQIVPSNAFENDNESLSLVDPSSVIVDTLIYEANKGTSFAPSLAEGEGVWANHTLIEDGTPLSWGRWLDGRDSNDNGVDFGQFAWSPGASNNAAGSAYSADFDALTPGVDAPRWDGSFKNMRVIDPTVVGPAVGANNVNPNAIPASPQGGNAAIMWDETGGGNFACWLGAPGLESSFEAYVFLAPTPVVTTGQHESWSIGIQGTTGSFYNSFDISGTLGAGFDANGCTGFSWSYQANAAGATLYLIDHNNGGWGANAISVPTVLATIPVSSGTNDGWQRLLLSVSGTTLTARFGGTLGNPDGTLYSATVAPFLGGVYVGYREFVSANSTLRPPTLDAVSINTCSVAHTAYRGHGTPSTVGIPDVSATSAVLGSSFGLFFSNMVPSSTAVVLVGLKSAAVDLSGSGAQPGCELYLAILDYVGVPTDGSGNGLFSLAVPNLPALCGGDLSFQALQIDGGLPFALPISTTLGVDVRVGL